MSEHDDDIDFDFFAEPKTEPPKRRLVRRTAGPPPSGPTPPRGPIAPAPGVTPLVRLVSLIAFAIAVVLILVFAIRSCRSSQEASAYNSYIDKVQTIATDSQSVGKQLSTVLATAPKESVLESKLQGLVAQQNLDIEKAMGLTPPGPLRNAHARMIEALQLRRNGLTGLLTVFAQTANKKNSVLAGKLLSDQGRRLTASDVVWEDLFQLPARSTLRKEGVSGVSPPASVFLADPELASRTSMVAIWQRLHGVQTSGGTTPGGLHGTQIEYVKVFPSGTTLQEGVTATIQLKDDTTFEVGVHNGGDFMEQNVKVTFTIDQPDNPVVKHETISSIYNGTTEAVVFKAPFQLTTIIKVVKIIVDVAPVAGEQNLTNNKATYEVRFSY
jgi:hypothetical protein